MGESATNQLELRPHHCGISVPNLEASIAWYRDVLGFSVDARGHIKKAQAEVAFMKHGNFYIELFQIAIEIIESGEHSFTIHQSQSP